ncbi:hypothetical protein [Oceaniglobus roseus]|uniref:hypothetical protein n=1 Tax=Oceaniglobus roseus TaxID=1737570 RepID=UPI000C7F0030|nr:hypothetical protein [Kandeliimicrobium roseum]
MTPEDHVQEWLDVTGALSLTDDYDSYRQRILLPLRLETLGGTTMIRCDADLAQTFADWRAMLERLGIRSIRRTVETVRPLGPNRIYCSYRTVMEGEGGAAAPAYPGAGVLCFDDGVWKANEMWVGVENTSFPLTDPRTDEIHDESEAFRRFAEEKKT